MYGACEERRDQDFRCRRRQCRNDDPVRHRLRRHRLQRDHEPLRGPYLLPHADDRYLERQCPAQLPGSEFVGEPQCIEHHAQPRIENTVESENKDMHDTNDLKVVINDYTRSVLAIASPLLFAYWREWH